MSKTEVKHAAQDEILQLIDNGILIATEAKERAESYGWELGPHETQEFIDELVKQKQRVKKIFGF